MRPEDDPRLAPLYYIHPNAREDAYNRGVMDAAKALAAVPAHTPGALDVERLARALVADLSRGVVPRCLVNGFDITPREHAAIIAAAYEATSPSEETR